MAKKNKNRNGKKGFFSKVGSKFRDFRDFYWHRKIFARTITLGLALVLLISGFTFGKYHQSRELTKKAMTVSDTDQELAFSKTGSEVILDPQRKNKNMAVIPIQIKDTENLSFDAKDYKIFLKAADKKYPLPSNISASFAIFGSTGEAAVVLRGDLKNYPIQIMIRNDKNFEPSDDDSGSGTITFDGREQKVDYNGVAFTVNPKGKNVKQDDRIQPDMSMSDLYTVALGARQLDENTKSKKIGEEQLETAKAKKEETKRRIQELNNALGRDKDDYKLNDKVDGSDDAVNGIVDEESVGDLDQLDLSSSDMESLRNSLISKLDTQNDDIESIEMSLKGVESDREKIEDTIDSMDSLVTLSNRYEVQE